MKDKKDPWFLQTINHGHVDFLEAASLNFNVTKEIPRVGDFPIPEKVALMRDTDKQFYRLVPDIFEVIQPDEFEALVEKIGGPIHAAGSTENAEIIWFATIPQDKHRTFTLDDELYRNYILFALSYTSDIGIAIVPVTVNETRGLTFNVPQLLNRMSPRIRQGKNIKARSLQLKEFKSIYNDCITQIEAFKVKLRRLSEQPANLLDILDELQPLDNVSDNKLTRTLNLREDVEGNFSSTQSTSLLSAFSAFYAAETKKTNKKTLTLARKFFAGKLSPLAEDVMKKLETAA